MKLHNRLSNNLSNHLSLLHESPLNSSRSIIRPPTDRHSPKIKPRDKFNDSYLSPVTSNKHAASPQNRVNFKLPFLRSYQQSPTSCLPETSLKIGTPTSKDRIPELITSPFPLHRFSIGRQTPISHRNKFKQTNVFNFMGNIENSNSLQSQEDFPQDLQRSRMAKDDIEAIFANMRDISIVGSPLYKNPVEPARHNSLEVLRHRLDEMLEVPLEQFYKPEEVKKMKKKMKKHSIFTFLDKKLPLRLVYRRKSCYCNDCGNRPKIQKDVENNPWVSLLTGWDESKIADTYITRIFKPFEKDKTKTVGPYAKKVLTEPIKRRTVGTGLTYKKRTGSKNNLDEKNGLLERQGSRGAASRGWKAYFNISPVRKHSEASRDDKSARSTIIHSGATSFALDKSESSLGKRAESPEPQQAVLKRNMMRILRMMDPKLPSKKDLSSLTHAEVPGIEEASPVTMKDMKNSMLVVEDKQVEIKALKTMEIGNKGKREEKPALLRIVGLNGIKKDDGREAEKNDGGQYSNRARHIRKKEETFLDKILKFSEKSLGKKMTLPDLHVSRIIKAEEETKDEVVESERKARKKAKIEKEDLNVSRSEILLKTYMTPNPRSLSSIRNSPFHFEGSRLVSGSRDKSLKKEKKKKKREGIVKLKLKKVEDKKMREVKEGKDGFLLGKKLREMYNLYI